MTVLVLGAFDSCHWGQTTMLANAAKFGPVTVGLTSDSLAEQTKRKPLFTYLERKEALEALGVKVVPRNRQDATDLVLKVKPQWFVCGNDWLETTHLADLGFTVEFLNKHRVGVIYLPRPHLMSTSEIVRRAKEAA